MGQGRINDLLGNPSSLKQPLCLSSHGPVFSNNHGLSLYLIGAYTRDHPVNVHEDALDSLIDSTYFKHSIDLKNSLVVFRTFDGEITHSAFGINETDVIHQRIEDGVVEKIDFKTLYSQMPICFEEFYRMEKKLNIPLQKNIILAEDVNNIMYYSNKQYVSSHKN